MENRRFAHYCWCAVFIAVGATFAEKIAAAAEKPAFLTGKAAMGDWTSDAPGVRRKITVDDLPPPHSNVLAINPPHVISRPASAQPQVPPGFKIDMYASGFCDPRFLLTAPNGDIFIAESRANQIKIIRGERVESIQLFADAGLNKPLGLPSIRLDSIRNFSMSLTRTGSFAFLIGTAISKRAGRSKNWVRSSPAAPGFCAVADTGRATLFSRLTARRCMSQSVRVRMIRMMRARRIARASSNLIPMVPIRRFTHGEFEMLSASRFVRPQTNYG